MNTQTECVIDHFDGQIAWRETGLGEPVILLHAMAGSSTAWMPQLGCLGKKYRCIAWDMPGFGKSTPLGDSSRMVETVLALRNFVTNSLGLNSAHFVGLSVGGMILQHFGAAHPDMIKSLVILDSSPKFGFGGDSDATEFVSSILGDLDSGKSVEEFSNGMVRAIVGPQCPEIIKVEAIAAMSRATSAGLKLTTHLIGEHDALEKLQGIKSPTLVMAGENDTDTPPAYARYIAEQIDGARFEMIDNAGHLSNLENADAVNRHLLDFIGTQS